VIGKLEPRPNKVRSSVGSPKTGDRSKKKGKIERRKKSQESKLKKVRSRRPEGKSFLSL